MEANRTENIRKLVYSPSKRIFRRLDERAQRGARMIWASLRTHWYFLILVFVMNIGAAIFEGSTFGILAVALEVLTGQAVDLPSQLSFLQGLPIFDLDSDTLFIILVVLAVLSQLVRSFLEFGAEAASAHLQVMLEGDVRRKTFIQFMSMSYAFTRKYKTGDLTSYMDQTSYSSGFLRRVNLLISDLFQVIAYVILLFWLSWSMTLLAVVAVVVIAILARFMLVRVRRMAERFVKSSVKISEQTVEFLYGLRLIRSFAREDYVIAQVNKDVDRLVHFKRKGMIWRALVSPVIESSSLLGVSLFLIAGFLLLGDERATILPRLATYIVVLYRLIPRTKALNNSLAYVNEYWPYIERIADILRKDNKEYTKDGELSYNGFKENIHFQNVSLQYIEGEREAIKGIDFTIPKGTITALVGRSGSGKTTIADLILRLYDPTEGAVLVDGIDLRCLRWRDWRNQIGVVSQDSLIFHSTVKENIIFGRPAASMEEVIQAAKIANAHDFIQELDKGYGTMLGDQGIGLSGGQRQRIAIARAVLREPQILILDEATSDLDSESERTVQEALNRISTQRTVIIIAHRLSTIIHADQILVLERGQIVEKGKHQELIKKGGNYHQLWKIQSGITPENSTVTY